MTATKPAVPAVPGWFTIDETPTLLGSRCSACGVVAFPPRDTGCPNPQCRNTDFETVPLPRTGRVWSYTDARYQPPPPYVSPTDPYQPFVLAAVELDGDGRVVLGQMAGGCTLDDVEIGLAVEVVVEPLLEKDDAVHMVWRWRPVSSGTPRAPGTSGTPRAPGGEVPGA